MRNRMWLLAAWTLVTLIGVSVTSAAVGSVRNNVTDTVAPRFTVTDDTLLTAGTASPPSTLVDDGNSPTTTLPANEPGETSPSTTAAPETTSPPSTSPTTTQPPVPTTTQPPAPTTTAAPSVVKTYSAIGGTVTVEVVGGTVTLLGAVPNSGFSAQEKSRDDTDKVVVEFESESHTSKITVEIEGGQIVVDIDEEPEEDD